MRSWRSFQAVLEGAAVGELAAGVERRVGCGAVFDRLHGAPAAGGVVVVEGDAEGVDLVVAGGAVWVSSGAVRTSSRAVVFLTFGSVR